MAGQRESFTLYKKVDIEGYLDKISSGASRWLGGKTRMWCELYGTILYMFKDSKRTSAGAHQLDMTQVHMVRKTTNDKSGFQFEILGKDKQHIFSTPSMEECDKWIRHLQAAMTLKDQEKATTPRTVTVGVGDYEDIVVAESKTPSTPCIRIGASSATDPGYCEVEFQNPPTPSSSQSSMAASAASSQVAEDGDDGYSTVEFRPKSCSGQSVVVQPVQRQSSKEPDQPPVPPATRPVVEEEGAGYVKVEMRKKSLSGELPPPHQPCQSGSAGGEAEESQEGEKYTYATVQRKTTAEGSSAGKVEGSSAPVLASAPSGSSFDEDDELVTTAQNQHDPIPPFPYPLQSADFEPLRALQDFLSSNRKLCRPSFADRTATEDPVGDLKRALEELPL